MSHEPGAAKPDDESARLARSPSEMPQRPPRPQMSDVTPAPLRGPIVATGAVKAARSLWLLSVIIGLLAGYLVFLFREDQLERLNGVLADLDTSQDAATLEAVATLIFWATLGALAFVIVIEAIFVSVMMRRHGWVRWVLLVVLVVHAGVWVVVDAFAVPPYEQGIYLRLLLLAQLVLASAGLVLSLVPGASAWFKTEHESRRRKRA